MIGEIHNDRTGHVDGIFHDGRVVFERCEERGIKTTHLGPLMLSMTLSYIE